MHITTPRCGDDVISCKELFIEIIIVYDFGNCDVGYMRHLEVIEFVWTQRHSYVAW